MDYLRFDLAFKHLTNHDPFPWQCALYERFKNRDFPDACNLPTGLGKTNVIAIWLIAWLNEPTKIPRRLVYVVNRRTVVDQTTTEVENIHTNLLTFDMIPMEQRELAISTLRGQFADNRKWSADPSRPAVICGTVDMIGSRLLFNGYNVGFRGRPLHAGFLGQDALLIHDEAHLEPAFQALVETIQKEQHEREGSVAMPWPKLRVMALTATPRGGGRVFHLTDTESHPPATLPEPTEPLHHVWHRLGARKALKLTPVKRGDLARSIGATARDRWKESGKAVLVFVRTIDDVKTVHEQLTDKNLGVPEAQVLLLTGTLRGLERDGMVDTEVFRRFQLKTPPDGKTIYLVCTSAGEVGVDISADHMVCDLTTLDSIAQRLGRVNRRGGRRLHSAWIRDESEIDLYYESDPDPKQKDKPFEKARWHTLEILKRLRKSDADPSRHDASPAALLELQLTGEDREAAFAPPPTILPATDILFDSWALTTIRDKLPGRPAVGPYLHGIADNVSQTTIAWRAELDLLNDDVNPQAKLRAIFAKHRIRPHESLTVRSYQVTRFLKEITAAKVRPDLLDARLALIFNRNIELRTVAELIEDSGILNAEPTLVLPASFWGLDESGMLSFAKSQAPDRARVPSLDVADIEGYEREKEMKPRLRILIKGGDDGWRASPLPGGTPLPAALDLRADSSGQLVRKVENQAKKLRLKIRHRVSIQVDAEGDAASELICLSPVPQETVKSEQTLREHVGQVEDEAARFAAVLLANDKVFNAALRFAAAWHDEGKKAERWQRYIGGPNGEGEPLGKSADWRNPKLLAGYRHEFGSLLRISVDVAHGFFADAPGTLNPQQQSDALDLALHLIAAHHGYARPHFITAWDEDFPSAECETAHVECIRRYARLQRKYGRWGLAYLESLLRAADAAASRMIGVDPEVDDDDETLTSDGGES